MHGNNKTEAELRFAFDAGDRLSGAGLVRGDRARRPAADRPQEVLIRVTPGIKPSTHSYIQTGQLDSKFGFGLEDGLAAEAVRRVRASQAPASWSGSTPTSGPRSSSSSPTRDDRAAGRLHRLRLPAAERRRRTRHRLHGRGRAGFDRGLRGRQGEGRAAGVRPGAAHPDRARPLAGRQRGHHRLPDRDDQGDPRRAHLRGRRRRHVGQPAPDAVRRALRGGDRGSARRDRRPTSLPSRACTASRATS